MICLYVCGRVIKIICQEICGDWRTPKRRSYVIGEVLGARTWGLIGVVDGQSMRALEALHEVGWDFRIKVSSRSVDIQTIVVFPRSWRQRAFVLEPTGLTNASAS